MRQHIAQDLANGTDEIIRESFGFLTESEHAIGQVSISILCYYNAKIEGTCLLLLNVIPLAHLLTFSVTLAQQILGYSSWFVRESILEDCFIK